MNAAIDVGSNTVRMLIGEVSVTGGMIPATYLRAITRLRGGFKPTQGLSSAAMERTLAALQEFAVELAGYDVGALAVAGTAALRQAPNGHAFVARVREKTGLAIEILSGEKEASLTASGVLAALDPTPETALIFDVGGGSTEFILVNNDRLCFRASYPLGVVSLCEETSEPDQQRTTILSHLDQLEADLARHGLLALVRSTGCSLVGTAGTVTTLAALQLRMEEYDWRRVNNLVLDAASLEAWHERLQLLSVTERERLPGLEQGRGDLILPGLEIVLALVERLHKAGLTVSDFGLLEGLLLSLQCRD